MRALNKNIFSVLIILVFSSLAVAESNTPMPSIALVPGGIAVIPLSDLLPATLGNTHANLHASIDGHRIFIQHNAPHAPQLIIGIPLASRDFIHITVHSQNGTQKITVPISHKKYPAQHITLPPSNPHVHPSKAELARYSREAQEQQFIYNQFSEENKTWPLFTLPTAGKATESFGLQRFFNGEPRAPHLGMDIAAPEGQTVVAPADGVVVQTGDYFFNGRTVMIDHGMGLISMLCHLSKISVPAGTRIKRGEEIGLIGHTGRATGPHLHWTVSLNNARIDPLLVLPTRTEKTAP